MTGVLVKVVVFDQSLYIGTGLVNKWMVGVTESFGINARLEAPVNKRANTGHGAPGLLRSSISTSVNRVGPRQITGDVSVNVPYALYVLRGTTGPIFSTKGFRYANSLDKRLTGPYRRVTRKTHQGPGGKGGRGRGTYLVGKPGYFMKLPGNPAFGGNSKYHYAVSGQRANNFLIKGYDRTARSHRALQPMAPGFLTSI